MSDFEGKICVFYCDSDFNIIKSYEKNILVNSLTSSDVFSKEFTPKNVYSEYLYAELYDKDGNFIMRQTELFVPPKQFEWKKPNINTKISVKDGKTVIDIKADTFAKGVYIDFDKFDLILSDNFFDLTNNKAYRITVQTELSPEELNDNLKIMSVYDIDKPLSVN